MASPRFGIDLITFFNPTFWGVSEESDVVALGQARPRMFWDTMLDAIAESGITGLELTFAPFDWRGTIAAYGSAMAFRAELDRRGLAVASGFFADVAISGDVLDPAQQSQYFADAADYADYLVATGAATMAMGLPMRASWAADPAFIVDLAYVSQVADFCNRLGAMLRRRGVRLALHTEAHSTFSFARDVDLLMTLTDPVYVGFCPDTAQLLVMGADPMAITRRYGDRVILTHWKDATGPMSHDLVIDETIHVQHRAYF